MTTNTTNWLKPNSLRVAGDGSMTPILFRNMEPRPLWRRFVGSARSLVARSPKPKRFPSLETSESRQPAPNRPESEMKVERFMSRDVTSISPETSIQEIAEMLVRNRISSVPVVDRNGRLVGVVADSDLMMRAELGTEPRLSWWRWLFNDAIAAARSYVRSHGRKARDVMDRYPVRVTEGTAMHKAATLLASKGLDRLPVVRGGRLVGVISRTHFVRKLASYYTTSVKPEQIDDGTIREHMITRMASMPWNLRIRAVNATVEKGIASIYGWVRSDIERRALQVLAENTPGVDAVKVRLYNVQPYV